MKLGFSLIELLIVLTVISILSLISYPLYNGYIIRTHRIYMAATLLDAAVRMEKYYALHSTYDGATTKILLIDETPYKKYYNLQITPAGDLYTLKAIPTGQQAKDISCGSLTINQAGNKTVSGTDGGTRCWYAG